MLKFSVSVLCHITAGSSFLYAVYGYLQQGKHNHLRTPYCRLIIRSRLPNSGMSASSKKMEIKRWVEKQDGIITEPAEASTKRISAYTKSKNVLSGFNSCTIRKTVRKDQQAKLT